MLDFHSLTEGNSLIEASRGDITRNPDKRVSRQSNIFDAKPTYEE